ncbi:MAG: hypothetical protein Q7K16_03765 [Candidatus Azambacteria bacterium]|nr:hypothetical protein [Candidatus Azambacteria bacterium]
MEQDNQKVINPHELAKAFELQIKGVVAQKFSVALDDLVLLLEDKDGVYFSKEEPNTLCCFVVGQKNGFLYLVTGKIEESGKSLTNLKSDIVS